MGGGSVTFFVGVAFWTQIDPNMLAMRADEKMGMDEMKGGQRMIQGRVMWKANFLCLYMYI